jgi:hypothetical protein
MTGPKYPCSQLPLSRKRSRPKRKISSTREGQLPRIHQLPTAGLEKKNCQPACVLNLEKLGFVEDG